MDHQGPMVLPSSERPGGILTALDDLLKQPTALVARTEAHDGLPVAARVLAASILAWGVYGAVAGLFQGGVQTLVAALKAPVIVLLTMLLCAPSFYVFGALAGTDLSGRRMLAIMVGLSGMLALLMLGLLPIAWLFTVSSSSLWFVVWLHVLVWAVALVFAFRFLTATVGNSRARGALVLWMLLFAVVSCQVTTYLRPVLAREPGAPLVESGKMFFLEHFGQVSRADGRGER
jgi:hypothetical protein